MYDAKIVSGEHHRIFFRMRIIGIYFRMSAVMMPRKIDRFFIKRIRYRAVDFAFHRQIDNLYDALKRGFSAHGAHFSVFEFRHIDEFEMIHVDRTEFELRLFD